MGRNISLACSMSFAGETPTVEWTMELEEEGLGDPLQGNPDEEGRSVGVAFDFLILQKVYDVLTFVHRTLSRVEGGPGGQIYL